MDLLQLVKEKAITRADITTKAAALIKHPWLVEKRLGTGIGKMHCYIEAAMLGKTETCEDSFFFYSNPDQRIIVAGVADGVGGTLGGEIASNLMTSHIPSALGNLKKTRLGIDDVFAGFKEGLDNATRERNAMIQLRSYLSESDTTFTALILVEQSTSRLDGEPSGFEAWVAHIGDSRLYEFGAQLIQHTQDDSYVRALKEAGYVNSFQVAVHRMKNVVTNAVFTNPHSPDKQFGLPFRIQYLGPVTKTMFVLVTDGIGDQFLHISDYDELTPLLQNCMTPLDLIAAAEVRREQEIEGLSKLDDKAVLFVYVL